ncbi:MAG: hypothetical protein LBV26_05475 [Bacteroidales bacterium]|jgi:galactokinase|nr:hypothetical protein [Bacteroidales bacterium]
MKLMKNYETLKTKILAGGGRHFVQLYGAGAGVAEYQTCRYVSALERFKSFSGLHSPQFFSAPGRTEIGGNHTDHNNGMVLAGAVNIDNIAVAAANGSGTVRIESFGYPSFEVSLHELQPVEAEKNTPASLVRGIASRLQELGFGTGGFDAVIDGCVPKGSGLSSSASFEVLVGTIFNHLFNNGTVMPVCIAQTGQYAENVYFGKPCGLMDQVACTCGGFVAIDFADTANPAIRKIAFDLSKSNFSLVITNTGGSHENLTPEYASVFAEMKSVAGFMGAKTLRGASLEKTLEALPEMRNATGDRAILRAIHFYNENTRVAKQVAALERNDFNTFLELVTESGYSSYMLNQNVYTTNSRHEQSVALGLAISELLLKGRGAWRVHGGGFAGTIQAFVPENMSAEYIRSMEHIFGAKACNKLLIREKGAIRVDLS